MPNHSYFKPPKRCPVCRTTLERDGAYLKCPNDLTCPAQVEGNIKRWVTKLGIKDLGDSLIKALVEHGNMREPADLYHLRPKVLANFRTSGKKVGFSSANRIVDNIQATRELPLARFVGSLGIDMCSRSVCETICEAGFDTLGKMVDATVADLMTVPKMGKSKAEAFVEGLQARKTFINNLLDAGVRIKKPIVGKMTGKSFCFTQVRDKDLERKIEAQGGIVKGNFSRSLSYVVTSKAGLTKSGSKLDKARQHDIPIIDVDELEDMLGSTRRFGGLPLLPDSVPWGTIYGLPYDLPDGRRVWLCRGKYNRVRFYTDDGEQVGPEQSNVVPAVAFAIAQGWRQAHG